MALALLILEGIVEGRSTGSRQPYNWEDGIKRGMDVSMENHEERQSVGDPFYSTLIVESAPDD